MTTTHRVYFLCRKTEVADEMVKWSVSLTMTIVEESPSIGGEATGDGIPRKNELFTTSLKIGKCPNCLINNREIVFTDCPLYEMKTVNSAAAAIWDIESVVFMSVVLLMKYNIILVCYYIGFLLNRILGNCIRCVAFWLIMCWFHNPEMVIEVRLYFVVVEMSLIIDHSLAEICLYLGIHKNWKVNASKFIIMFFMKTIILCLHLWVDFVCHYFLLII